MSLIRKVTWPAMIALALLVAMAAMGSGSVRTASASSDPKFCSIDGPKVITVGKTYLYIGRLDHWSDDVIVDVSIDNIIGNSKITSYVDGGFEFGDYRKVGPTNVVHDLDVEDVFNIDTDLLDFFASKADTAPFANSPVAIPAFTTDCGDIRALLLEMIAKAIDRGNACNFFLTFTTSCFVHGTSSAAEAAAIAAVAAAQVAADNAVIAKNNALLAQANAQATLTSAMTADTCITTGCACAPSLIAPADVTKCAAAHAALTLAQNNKTIADNNVTAANNTVASTAAALLNAQILLSAVQNASGSSEQLYNDFDIDCPSQTSCSIAGNIITAVVDAIIKDINGGENECDDLAQHAENAAILAGAAELVAAQFNDYIDDVCWHRWSDDFINALAIVDVTCNSAGNFDITFSDQSDEENSISMNVICRGAPSSKSTIACDPSPCSVEIIPAMGNISHSLITVTLIDADGNQAGEGNEVDFTVDRCSIEAGGVATAATYGAARTTFRAWNVNSPASAAAIEASPSAVFAVDATRQADNAKSIVNTAGDTTVAAAVLGCNPDDANPTATPGVATILAIIAVSGQDIVLSTKVTVVGPPFSMTISASPATVRCGEKSTITVSVKDAIGQNVSEHTRIEAVTNAGGVLGGTGAVANNSAPVTPISSTVGETFAGQATFYLLTSEQHSGPYEVVVTTGGSGALGNALGGVFSTPPVVIQTTVTCTLPQPVVAAPSAPAPAPTITAPRTGQGPSISPPNTGDAGLASTSGSSLALFALVTLVAFVVGGIATVKFARR